MARAAALPVRVSSPRLVRIPLEWSAGTRPSQAISFFGFARPCLGSEKQRRRDEHEKRNRQKSDQAGERVDDPRHDGPFTG